MKLLLVFIFPFTLFCQDNKYFFSVNVGVTRQFTTIKRENDIISNQSKGSEKLNLSFNYQSANKINLKFALSRLNYWQPAIFYNLRHYYGIGESYQLSSLIGYEVFERKKTNLHLYGGFTLASLFTQFNKNNTGSGSQQTDTYYLTFTNVKNSINHVNILLQLNLEYSVKIGECLFLNFNQNSVLGLNKLEVTDFVYTVIQNNISNSYKAKVTNYGTHLDFTIGLKYFLNNKKYSFNEKKNYFE
jgi:hypothetical protein